MKKPRQKAAPIPPPPQNVLATSHNDVTIPNYTTTMRPQDETLIQRGGGKGIGLYRSAGRDGRAYTAFQKRRRALVARAWRVTPASEDATDVRAAELVEAQLTKLPFDRIALGLLSAQLMGFSTAEVVWDRDGSEIIAREVRAIKQERIVFGYDWQPRLLTREAMADGIEMPERKIITHRFEDDGSDPYGFGLGSIIFWHVLFKREGVAFWLKAMERFAVPVPIAKYPYGQLPAEQEKLLHALSSAVVSGAIVVPAGTEVEFAKGMISGTMRQEDWVRYWDEQTAEAILGETLTTNVGASGSRAAAEVHKGVKDELIDGDADELAGTLNETLIRWISEYNVPDATPPQISWERPQNLAAEETARKARSDRQQVDIENISRLKTAGFEPENVVEVLTDVMGFKVRPATLKGSTALTPPASFAEPAYRGIIDTLSSEAELARREWVEKIRAGIADLLARGGELKDLPDALLKLYPQLSTERLSLLLGDAMTLAEMQGRGEAMDETQ